MSLAHVLGRTLSVGLCATLFACDGPPCGPEHATVVRALDGDTVVLEGGTRVRYLLVDAPELSSGACYAAEAQALNAALTVGRRVSLHYDAECTDNYGRLLAYVAVGEREVNRLLIERGHACVLHVPPNGRDRVEELRAAEQQAKAQGRGLWGVCPARPCR